MKITSVVILLLISIMSMAQPTPLYKSTSPKAIALYETAYKMFNVGKNDLALTELQKSIEADPNFTEAYMLMSEIYHIRKISDKEIECYNKILTLECDNKAAIYFYLSEAYFKIGRYKEANYNIQKSLAMTGLTHAMRNDAHWILLSSKFAIEAEAKPVAFSPINLGTQVNSQYNDYWPTLTADDSTLIFTVEQPSNSLNVDGKHWLQEDLFVANKLSSGKWAKAEEIGAPINTDENEGGQTISFDGRYLFFTLCNSRNGGCDIYYSERIGNAWKKPQPLGAPINSKMWESQPCLSPDGRTLYFVSNRQGSKGGKDIWCSRLDDSGLWSQPENLGDSINTPDDEMSPFIHHDGQTLYFSSNGHIGMGGQDLFVSRKVNGKWTKPQNLGYPINTYNDEIGLVVNRKGDIAYFASDREENKGKDIYSFVLPENVRPQSVSFVKGKIYDADSKKNISADLELSDLETATIVAKTKSIEGSGEYLVCLPTDKDYGLNISKDGYLFYSENFSLKGNDEPYNLNVDLKTIKEGETVILKNIFYDTGSYQLKNKSKYELDKLSDFLKSNPNVIVEIGGHTDTDGDVEHNQILSENRAKVVYEYLLQQGISSMQIEYKGYNFSKPISDNKTIEGKAQNRRTEFKIIKVKK